MIRRQLKLINIDPYANAFNVAPTGAHNKTDFPQADPMVFERKWEIDSHCYPLRLAHHYWKTTGDTSVFDGEWTSAMRNIVKTLREQQMKEGPGDYIFLRTTDRQLDTRCHVGRGNPVKPVGLIVSAFRPSDDATTFGFLVPSNFMAVTSLRKAAEILTAVNGERELAAECTALADEVAGALQQYAVVEHPEFGKSTPSRSMVSAARSLWTTPMCRRSWPCPIWATWSARTRFTRTRAGSCGARKIPISGAELPERASEDPISASK